MNPQLSWWVARAAGITAWVLLSASVAWGLFLSTRLLGHKPPPAWLLDLHRFLGGSALAFTAVHVGALVADNYVHFGASEVLIPFASEWKSGAVAWGVVACYLLIAVEVTSLAMRRLPRRVWRAVHVSSFAVFVASAFHGAAAGTDAANVVYRVVAVGLTVATLFLTLVRILADRRARRPARQSGRVPVPA